MRWQHAQLDGCPLIQMRGCVVGMAEGCFEMEPGSCRAFAWPLILLNSSSTITHTHCLKQGCRMETMGSSPGLTDLCPILFISRLPFQTLLPEPSQSLLDEEDEEDPARGTTDRDLFHSDPAHTRAPRHVRAAARGSLALILWGGTGHKPRLQLGCGYPKRQGAEGEPPPEPRGSPWAAAAQDTRGEAGTTGKVSCFLVSPNYAEGPYHRLHLFCLYSTGLVACLTMHGALFSLQPLKPQN